jgi:hypothetical protein
MSKYWVDFQQTIFSQPMPNEASEPAYWSSTLPAMDPEVPGLPVRTKGWPFRWRQEVGTAGIVTFICSVFRGHFGSAVNTAI